MTGLEWVSDHFAYFLASIIFAGVDAAVGLFRARH